MPDYMPPPSALPAGSSVWVYLRDSGGYSQELSVQQQRQEAEAYAQVFGLIIRHTFADIARSGTSVVGRDDFNDMIDMFGDPGLRPKGLLLWNFARFARELDDASYYKSLIRKQGTVIHSLTDPIPEGDYGRIIETFIDITNAEKSRQTSRDVKRALRALTRQGYACGGFPPCGYKAEAVVIGMKRDGSPRKVSRWVPDPETWDLVQLAWKLRAQRRPYHIIQQATGARLFKTKNGWTTFFRNKTYLGIGKCGEEEFPDHHPAAIDQTTWEAVQQVRRAHPKLGDGDRLANPRRQSASFILSGFSYCIVCGAAMQGRTYDKKGVIWRCYTCNRKSLEGARSCANRLVNARHAEILILDTLINRVLTPEYFNTLLTEVQSRLEKDADLESQIQAYRKSLSEVERAIQNLMDTIENFGALSAGERLRQREAEKTELAAHLARLEGQRAARLFNISPQALEQVFTAWREQVTESIVRNDLHAVRVFTERFLERVELGYDRVRIHYRYPLDSTLAGQEKPERKEDVLSGSVIELPLARSDRQQFESIYAIAPQLFQRKARPKTGSPNIARDKEIYCLHTQEGVNIKTLAERYGLSKERIFTICWSIRKAN